VNWGIVFGTKFGIKKTDSDLIAICLGDYTPDWIIIRGFGLGIGIDREDGDKGIDERNTEIKSRGRSGAKGHSFSGRGG
jgi:hypothetical protein